MKWKLKDNIRFEELEKFGYKKDNGIYIKMIGDGTGRDSGTKEYLIVNYEDNDRVIYYRDNYLFVEATEYDIKDLIKADLVEKVDG